MHALILAFVIVLAASSPARAEPISGIIGLTALIEGAIGGSSIAIGAGVITAGQIGGALFSAALAVGLSFASSLLAPKASGLSSGVNTPDVRYSTRQAIPPKRVVFGAAQIGGALFFEQVKTPYLYHGLLLNHGEISGVEKLWIGTNQVGLSDIVEGRALVPANVPNGPNYQGRLVCSFRFGADGQAIDPLLAADFLNLSAEFRQRGIATAVFRYHYGANYNEFTALWGQVQRPNAYMLVRGVKVFDPRDPTQDLSDPATWKFTNNASLVLAYYLTQPWGGRIDAARIDWDKVKASADWDDGLVGVKAGGFVKRYTIDGVVTLNQSPAQIVPALLSANRGRLHQSGGKVWVASAYPKTPIATVYDAILAGGIEFRNSKPKRDLLNRLKVRFIAEDREYQLADGPLLDRADLQTADGEILEGTLELPFTLDHRRAQRIQKAFLEESRLGKTITARVDVIFLAQCADDPIGNAVRVASDLFPAANGIYRVESWGFADGFATVELALTEYDATIETDWDCSVDEQDFTLAPLDVS